MGAEVEIRLTLERSLLPTQGVECPSWAQRMLCVMLKLPLVVFHREASECRAALVNIWVSEEFCPWPEIHQEPSAAFVWKAAALPWGIKAAPALVGIADCYHSQVTQKVYGQLLKRARCFQGDSLKSTGTKKCSHRRGSRKTEIQMRVVLEEAAISMLQARNNLQ